MNDKNINNEENSTDKTANHQKDVLPDELTCHKCGKQVSSEMKFCPYCSTKLKKDPQKAEAKLSKKRGITLLVVGIVALLIVAFSIYWFAIKCHHNYTYTITTYPTCITEGLKTYTCTKCGNTYTEKIEKDENAHKYEGKIIKEATCTTEGEKSFTCTICNDNYTEKIEKDENAHKFEEKIVKEATCTEDGQIETICNYCGKSTTKTITASHNWTDATCSKPKTCKTCGLTEGSAKDHSFNDVGKCEDCGYDWTSNIVIPSLPKSLNYYHSNISSDIETTCEVEDVTFSCSKQGSSWALTINFTTLKTYDQNGNNSNDNCTFGVKILDDSGTVVYSEQLRTQDCMVGEKTISSIYFYVPTIGNYRIELFEDTHLNYGNN